MINANEACGDLPQILYIDELPTSIDEVIYQQIDEPMAIDVIAIDEPCANVEPIANVDEVVQIAVEDIVVSIVLQKIKSDQTPPLSDAEDLLAPAINQSSLKLFL